MVLEIQLYLQVDSKNYNLVEAASFYALKMFSALASTLNSQKRTLLHRTVCKHL